MIIIYTSAACDACDKYELCPTPLPPQKEEEEKRIECKKEEEVLTPWVHRDKTFHQTCRQRQSMFA